MQATLHKHNKLDTLPIGVSLARYRAILKFSLLNSNCEVIVVSSYYRSIVTGMAYLFLSSCVFVRCAYWREDLDTIKGMSLFIALVDTVSS